MAHYAAYSIQECKVQTNPLQNIHYWNKSMILAVFKTNHKCSRLSYINTTLRKLNVRLSVGYFAVTPLIASILSILSFIKLLTHGGCLTR